MTAEQVITAMQDARLSWVGEADSDGATVRPWRNGRTVTAIGAMMDEARERVWRKWGEGKSDRISSL